MIRCFLEKVRHVARHIHNVARVGRGLSRPRRVHRPSLWRWTCIAAPPLVGVPGIAWSWSGLPTGWGVAIPAVARGAAHVVAVPEPSSLALLGPALALVFIFKRRSR